MSDSCSVQQGYHYVTRDGHLVYITAQMEIVPEQTIGCIKLYLGDNKVLYYSNGETYNWLDVCPGDAKPYTDLVQQVSYAEEDDIDN